MKLYYFSRHNCGTDYIIMAKSQKAALESLKTHCAKTCIPYVDGMEDYNYFANGKGSIFSHSEGEVLEVEVR